jgi:hypothetical protein
LIYGLPDFDAAKVDDFMAAATEFLKAHPDVDRIEVEQMSQS